MGKSQFRKVVVTPVLSVEEETWDKSLVEMELSYPDPASPAHIDGVKFASPVKVGPENKKTQAESKPAHKDTCADQSITRRRQPSIRL